MYFFWTRRFYSIYWHVHWSVQITFFGQFSSMYNCAATSSFCKIYKGNQLFVTSCLQCWELKPFQKGSCSKEFALSEASRFGRSKPESFLLKVYPFTVRAIVLRYHASFRVVLAHTANPMSIVGLNKDWPSFCHD